MINKIRYKKTYFCFLSSAFCFFLLLTVGCKSTNNNEDKQQVEGDSTSINLQASALPQSWDSKLDSLLYESTIAIPDTNLAKLYISIGNMYHGNNFKKAEEYYLKADSLSEKLTWNKGSFQSCQHLGNLMLRQGLYDSAIVVTKKGFDFAEKENNELMFGSVYTNLGNCYRRKEWYETALENYKNAIQIFEKNDDIWKLAQVYDAMGTTYRSLSLMDEGIKYGEKALAILNKKPDTLTRAAALINLGSSYHLKNMDDEAEKYFREALRISKIYNNKNNLISIYNALGNIALVKFEFDSARMYAEKAMQLRYELTGQTDYYFSKFLLGWIEELKGNFNQSEKLIKEALELAINSDMLSGQVDCYFALTELSIAQKNFRNYLIYKKKADSVVREIAMENIQRASQELEVKYETEKKEREIERQQNMITKHKMQSRFLASGIIVCIVILIMLWYMLRLRNKRNRALAEINATKDKFFSIISHDIKSPAIAQRDTLKMLVNNTSCWDIETLSGHLHDLLKSAEGEVELIYNLLNWAQVQTGRMAFMPTTFALTSCLRPEIKLIQEMAKNKEITLLSQIPDEALVTADCNMIATVVRNLLNNAVKFTPKGGMVTLNITPTRDANHIAYRISVSDTGIGMNEKQIHSLFRLDHTRSNRGPENESSGLGLIVCKELLEKHGSTLHVESEEGKGSRFWFELKIEN